MVFQDFDQISERRRLERQRKFRKRVTIAIIASFVLVVTVAASAFAVVSGDRSNDHKQHKDNKEPQKSAEKQISRVENVVKTVCNATTYKDTCRSTLIKAMQKNSKTQPKDIVKITIKAGSNEIDNVVTKISQFKFSTPQEKAAFEDCKVLIGNAKEELNESISLAGVDGLNLAKHSPDLNNWLSAVMSYQQTCIDGFPDGKLKTDMHNAFNAAKQLTSNSLALISSLSSLHSAINVKASRRRLMGEENDSVDTYGVPHWISHDERRMLKGAKADKPTPNVTVAKDGSGNFTTISAALAAMPAKYNGRYIIYVKVGTYDETVTLTKNMVNVTMYGDGSQKSVVTGNKNFVDGVQTFRTASFAALGDGFIAQAMGFRNTAGPEKHQAVAIRVQADRSIFMNCRFEGYQDTLYAQTHRQFYRSCVISGTVDFIFGDAAVVFQNCQIIVRKPLDNQQNIVTAQGKSDEHETTGIVLQNCRLEPDKELVTVQTKIKSYLGRPWKEYSRTIIMESTIGDFISPNGWLPWEGDFGLKTLYYAEYNNQGPGASTSKRVKWPGYHVINKQEAMKYTVEIFLQGTNWISASGSPVRIGLGK